MAERGMFFLIKGPAKAPISMMTPSTKFQTMPVAQASIQSPVEI